MIPEKIKCPVCGSVMECIYAVCRCINGHALEPAAANPREALKKTYVCPLDGKPMDIVSICVWSCPNGHKVTL